MPDDTDQGLLRFAEKLITLLDQGGFTATYKYAVLVGLMDLCLEESARDGSPPDFVTTRQLARKVVELYWPHTRPFESGRVLLQNRGGQAEIVALIERFRERHAPDPSAPLYRARLHDQRAIGRLESDVEWKLIEMPLPKLQRVGRSLDSFLYTIAWDDSVRRRELASGFDNRILFRPGAAAHLIALAGVIRPLIHRHWIVLVTRLNGIPESRLEAFLFDRDRAAVATLAEPLLELQRGCCFYCAVAVPRGEREVDHFIPWARHPDDGIANLVCAHARCNRRKSDFLADVGHVERWGRRLERQRADLAAIAEAKRWPREEPRSASVVRAVYGRLPADVRLWRLGDEFAVLDRPRLGHVLARLGHLTT